MKEKRFTVDLTFEYKEIESFEIMIYNQNNFFKFNFDKENNKIRKILF